MKLIVTISFNYYMVILTCKRTFSVYFTKKFSIT